MKLEGLSGLRGETAKDRENDRKEKLLNWVLYGFGLESLKSELLTTEESDCYFLEVDCGHGWSVILRIECKKHGGVALQEMYYMRVSSSTGGSSPWVWATLDNREHMLWWIETIALREVYGVPSWFDRVLLRKRHK